MEKKQKENISHTRLEIIEELYQRYRDQSGFKSISHSIHFYRKKYSWLFFVVGTRAFKRFLDIIISSTMAILLSPLFIIVAIIIKLTDHGTILFWQKRVGKWGKEFNFPKFRSMVINAEKLKDNLIDDNFHKDNITFKIKKDPRITWIGRIIRKFSIDELPQLLNVFLGDMSLVGPRPPLPNEVEKYTLEDRRRLDIKPGLTCIWQVSGRSDIPFEKQVELDTQYVESQGILMDFKILLKTIPAILTGKGAY